MKWLICYERNIHLPYSCPLKPVFDQLCSVMEEVRTADGVGRVADRGWRQRAGGESQNRGTDGQGGGGEAAGSSGKEVRRGVGS